MRKLEFIGTVRSNKGECSVQMVVPGRDSLVVAPADWPVRLAPGTLNIGVNDDGFPEGFEEIGEGDGLKKFDEGKFRPELAIPPWRIAGNTLPPIPDQPMRGAAQVWRAELQVIFTDRVAKCWMLRRIGSGIVSQIELVAQEHLRSRLNLCDDMAVKVTVWEAESKWKPKTPREIISDWCGAARGIAEDFGAEKAMGYLIGEKFLNFLEVAETDGQWRGAIPAFVSEIKALYEPWQLAEFLNTPRRLGALGHTASEEAHRMFREALEEHEKVREDARNLILLDWAKELLLEE
ncbi:MAG: hypothetical protein ACXWPK_09230 [Isosphaeraceae bacterium]|jgi:hypothetical protein